MALIPMSPLHLLVPPLRLLTAAMWQIAQKQSIRHYGMLVDFVSLVTKAVPQLLTDRQRSVLVLALRAKVTLSDLEQHEIRAHLDRIVLASEAKLDEDITEQDSLLCTLSELSSEARRCLLQDAFNQSFDSALLSLMSDFLSRIEQMFPVPDFKQAALWLDAAPSGLLNCLQNTDKEELKELLTSPTCSMGQATTTVGSDTEKILLSAFTKLTNPDPPPANSVDQSDHLPEVVDTTQLNVDLVKVEVVVMTTEEEQEQGEVLTLDQDVFDQNSSEGGDDCPVTPVFKLKNCPENSADQLRKTASPSDQPCSMVTASPLHNISHNAQQRVAHKCPQCGKCYIYRSQVVRHLRTNKACSSASTTSGAVNLQTPPGGCEKDPRPPEPLLPDSRRHRTNACFQCSNIFKTKAELRSHQRCHRARPVYQCSQCDKKFHHLSSLTNHKQTHLDRGGFTCSKCDKVFESAKQRDSHRLHHRLPQLSCTLCEKTFRCQTQLLRHLQTHSVEGAEPSYRCRFCDDAFSGVTQLRIHQRTHTPRSHQCNQCNKTYSSLTGLSSHQLTHTTESRFLCPQCGKRFKTRDGLEGHLRTHTGERPYRCPYCPKAFTALAGLNVHVRVHTGERPYVCTVCGKGWTCGGDLQKHMRTHTGERPYVCQECGKAFSMSCHLTEHRRIHTGEKPFSCPECGKCLRRKFDLKIHMLSHGSVRPYACVYCPKSYTRRSHFNRHLLTHRTAPSDAEVEVADKA
ncbi:zinc finger protein 431-like isoform X2 [Betta splendens]|uniref:Zinc finger protein 431-like isoform X2 n=1 Tax=Betta splendens TaxID=158456 RepID=A0A6P7L5Z6_BETSP|nr:zinc finger protein 431-like isoform X2 [Betta splendens]